MERSYISPVLFLIVLVGLINFNLRADNPTPDSLDWELRKERDGISIYNVGIKGSSFKRFKGVMVIEATPNDLVSLVDDISRCHEWIDTCKEGKLIKKIGPNESYTYTYNQAPWPVSDRDAVVHNKIEWSADRKQVRILVKAVPDMIPKVKGVVRVKMIKASWTFVMLANGQTKVVYDVHNDPGGSLPAWLVNATAVSQPFNTLKNMRKSITGTTRLQSE